MNPSYVHIYIYAYNIDGIEPLRILGCSMAQGRKFAFLNFETHGEAMKVPADYAKVLGVVGIMISW